MNTSPELRISIIVPSYNQAEFLGATLDSIFEQEYMPYQVLVIDGASTDGSVEVIKEYAARYPSLEWLSEPDSGPAEAVNKGLARVRGDVIGIQSSDDIYYPGALNTAAEVLAAHPDCGFIYGDYDRIDGEGNVLYRKNLPDFSWEAYFGIACGILQSSIFFRTSLAREVGYWNGDYYCCDHEYWLRMLFRTQAMHISQVMSGWRRYGAQRTQEDAYHKLWDAFWRMIDQSPDVAAASPRIQRLAQASKHIRVLVSPPNQSVIFAVRHLFSAFIKHPGFWRFNPRGILLGWIPGFRYPRAIFKFFRKRLGMAPDLTVPAPKSD